MQHLNDEELIAHHYHDADASEHLRACADCRAQYDTLRNVLALVDAIPVPDRDPEQVWNRLRWRLERRKKRTWQWIAGGVAAAVAIVVFFAIKPQTGNRQPQIAATNTTAATQQLSNPATQQPNNKVLVYVVTDHLDAAERVLAEVANANPKKGFDAGEQQKRAEELVDANRIYRQAASRRGDARIASLLSDIEPILVELSHSGAKLSPDELTSMQKRIDSKNLLFKMRVMSAQGEDQQQNKNVLASQKLNSL
ncbi:MAG TPA: hypothetical protein VJ901_17130 [Thermoanaerobaculia bacterium]|nr:hypothetical protein [Thermoanaerobaculia bacterium]